MMNAVWFALIAVSVVTAAFSGKMPDLSKASIESAKSAVTLAIGLIGVMTFWLGMMRILREGGLLHAIARVLRPVMTRLFPDVPPDHPAMSAMIMNLAANALGLGNAATPFGIKAMAELNRLNETPGVATNAMVLFLAINTSNIALAPLGVIALRASLGSANAAGIWLPTIFAHSLATVAAITSAKLLERVFPPASAYPTSVPVVANGQDLPDASETGTVRPTAPSGCALALALLALIAIGFGKYLRDGLAAGGNAGALLRAAASDWLLPVLIVAMLGYGIAKRVALYDTMIEGAREGFQVAVRIIPFLVAIVVAAGMFRASGALDILVAWLGPITGAVGFPAQALPMAILRPLSGSGAYAVMAEIMQAEGPDSYVGYLVSVLQGSTETTFYVLAVYFGSVGVTRVRHAVAAGLTADVFGIIGSLLAVRWLLT